jgi:hypothetical protein
MERNKDDLAVREQAWVLDIAENNLFPHFREANYSARLDQIRQRDNIDAKFGYEKVDDSKRRTAWLVNFQAVYLDYELLKCIF